MKLFCACPHLFSLNKLLVLCLPVTLLPQDLFQAGDSSQRGRLSLETLRDLIGRSQNKPPVDETSKVWNTIMDSLNLVSWQLWDVSQNG